ncbi:MAG: hypothetical protein PQJ61_14240 [Spirochaetales bacterium]|uniref:Uncharacterized protein n=1 Tax=Candidatus Thalassospirochaeta sargassi TaxID=3119039 RepID=A0AAJ1IHA5_9SPIO|nr:hypothetical protein [Spirochaetales bacterium]
MKLLTDIIKGIEQKEPRLFGLTVNEHLEYLKGLYDTFEEQYLMVCRLRERVQKKQTETTAEIKTVQNQIFSILEPDNPQAFRDCLNKNIYNTVVSELTKALTMGDNWNSPEIVDI